MATTPTFRFFSGLLILAGGFLSACRNDGKPMDFSLQPFKGMGTRQPPPVARIGGRNFSGDEFRQYRATIFQTLDSLGTLGRKENTVILNQFVESRLLKVAAEEAGLRLTGEDRQKLAATLGLEPDQAGKMTEEEMLAYKFLRSRLAGKIEVREAAVEDYYNQHRWEFVAKDAYHVREILVQDQTVAAHILEELLAGGKSRFSEYARQFSKAASAAEGGDMGYFHRGELPPEFEKIILSLKPGGFSPVIRTQYGFHIFYMEEIIREHAQLLFEAHDQIQEKLRQEKERLAEEELMAELYRKYRPSVFQAALDFQVDRDVFSKNIGLEDTHAK